MPVLSNAATRAVMVGSTKAKKVYLGTKLVWEVDQGAAAFYSGTGWYKAVDTGTVFCKGIPAGQTYSFTGDPKVYISVHTKADAILYADRAATSNMVDMNSLFRKSSTFNADISHWDVSNVTNMSNMFYYASAFNSNISHWDVSKVTDMEGLFYGASVFNQNISTWNVSNVTSMRNMFDRASVFNQNISTWNVSKVADMAMMFNRAVAFNQNISTWNVSNVTNMLGMFWGTAAFNQNLTKWCVTKIKSQPSYFNTDSALTKANLPKWGTCP